MDIKEFLAVYADIYNKLYEMRLEFIDIIEADYASIFEDARQEEKDFNKTITEAAKVRQDLFTSDRECAAAVLAYKVMQRREMFKRLTA